MNSLGLVKENMTLFRTCRLPVLSCGYLMHGVWWRRVLYDVVGGENGQTGWEGRGGDYLVTPSQAIASRLAGWEPREPAVCVEAAAVNFAPKNDTCVHAGDR